MNFAHFCEFWCFSLGKQARFTLNFCSGMPLRKIHELTFLWFGLPGPLLIEKSCLKISIPEGDLEKFFCNLWALWVIDCQTCTNLCLPFRVGIAPPPPRGFSQKTQNLEDPVLLKIRRLDPFCPDFLRDSSVFEVFKLNCSV